MSAHRYWRLNISAVVGSSNNATFTRIELHTTLGGTSLLPFWTAENVTNAAFYPQFVNNGQGQNWKGSTLPTYLAVDFGPGVTEQIYEVKLAPETASTQGPTSFTIDRSDDGSSWTTEATETGVSWSGTTAQTFATGASTAHRYWRVNVTAVNASTTASLQTCEWHTSGGGPQVATPFQLTVGSTGGSGDTLWGPVTAAFGGTPSGTAWGTSTLPDTYEFDFLSGNSYDLAEILITAPGSVTNGPISAMTIEYSDNNSSWTVANTFTGVTWTANQQKTFAAYASSGGPPAENMLFAA